MKITEDEARRLFAGDFGKQLLWAACDYCFPLYWSTPKEDAWHTNNNGTAFILDCGEGPFLVTAAHVYEGYLEARATYPNICPQLDDFVFHMERRVIDYRGSSELDIATFRITTEEIAFLLKKRGTVLQGNRSDGWPPTNVFRNEGALFAGFPGRQRTQKGSDECSFGFYASLTPVSSVSDRHFGCAFDRSKWVDTFGKGLPEEGYSLGGISGAPVLIVEESEIGILSWRLGGVAYNASNEFTEIMFAHHASFIGASGGLHPPSR